MKIKSIKKQLPIFIGLLLFLVSCESQHQKNATTEKGNKSAEYHLAWADEFEYIGLPDSSKWGYDTEGNDAGWGNNEAQFYTEARGKNAKVENGLLKITAHKDNFEGKEYSSARLISKADWKYCKVEVRAKLPDAFGTWSAIWMMPGGWTFNDGNWPDIGEIDIMEHVGHDLGVIHASAHSKDYQWQKQTQKTATINVPGVNKKFHNYILEWTPETMKAYVDDSLYFEYRNEGNGESTWPYDKPYYLILNIAVGGAWGSIKGIDANAFPQTMEIDYVRVYTKED